MSFFSSVWILAIRAFSLASAMSFSFWRCSAVMTGFLPALAAAASFACLSFDDRSVAESAGDPVADAEGGRCDCSDKDAADGGDAGAAAAAGADAGAGAAAEGAGASVEVRGTPEADTGGTAPVVVGSVVAALVGSGTGVPAISASIASRSSGDLDNERATRSLRKARASAPADTRARNKRLLAGCVSSRVAV